MLCIKISSLYKTGKKTNNKKIDKLTPVLIFGTP